MKAASIAEIRAELKGRSSAELTEICLRLARFKKENKELLSFLLFESGDLEGYVHSIKEELDEEFSTVNKTSGYQAKKTLRKILRLTNKYVRYAGSPVAETELLLYFCERMNDMGQPFRKNNVLHKIYQGAMKKARTALESLHEDLQHDYRRQLEALGD